MTRPLIRGIAGAAASVLLAAVSTAGTAGGAIAANVATTANTANSANTANLAGYTQISGAGSTWSQNAMEQWQADVAVKGMTVNYTGSG